MYYLAYFVIVMSLCLYSGFVVMWCRKRMFQSLKWKDI